MISSINHSYSTMNRELEGNWCRCAPNISTMTSLPVYTMTGNEPEVMTFCLAHGKLVCIL